jgi:hypothetical protein
MGVPRLSGAPWTLLRGALEPASIALWVLKGGSRPYRRERALRVWNADYTERAKWEKDRRFTPVPPAKSGNDRAAAVRGLAKDKTLGLRSQQISQQLSLSDTVADAGKYAGWKREEARARWREASGFAHGRTWPLLSLTSPVGAEVIRGGVGLALTVDEKRLGELARLTTDIWQAAIDEYGKLSNDGPD